MKLNFQSSSTSLTSVNGKIKDIRESEISSDGKVLSRYFGVWFGKTSGTGRAGEGAIEPRTLTSRHRPRPPRPSA